MKGWIISIVGIVFVSLLAEIMLPEGQTAKYIKGVISLMVIYVMLLPLPKLLNSDFDVKTFFNFSTTGYEIDESFIDIIVEDKQSKFSEELTIALKNAGVESADAIVLLDRENAVQNVIIKCSKCHSELAYDITTKTLGIKECQIVLYEV